jgi:hypothetical protein
MFPEHVTLLHALRIHIRLRKNIIRTGIYELLELVAQPLHIAVEIDQ